MVCMYSFTCVWGKAQCSHATMGVYNRILYESDKYLLDVWRTYGQAKIVVGADDLSTMLYLVFVFLIFIFIYFLFIFLLFLKKKSSKQQNMIVRAVVFLLCILTYNKTIKCLQKIQR